MSAFICIANCILKSVTIYVFSWDLFTYFVYIEVEDNMTTALSDTSEELQSVNSYQQNRLYTKFLMTPVHQEKQPYTVVLPNLGLYKLFKER